ncbi:hypothetical protein CHGG_01842 [Chaetomium globosum CBS 148.51]|uniref:Uncharacterized protein n=1 Tax=Chaetomium globosum (strain ATCC 6205 / CBS 148.51 / DSM 1962 / NBRC 6347 / NRRL 1970) TaxID=306901 RepID=Q2HD62_CHAGB|nr:uncharacterized protein CHGG_01842 [Chaetomium globosum CBS 148.51]EAQ93607.1 hypothetical protein CHGG_01842 [Chaetomium globosum CBS 148.51]
MPLPRSPDVSSSTLGWSGSHAPAHHPLAPPPLREVERYGKRSLPPVPLQRDPRVSAFSKEVDEALATPAPVVSPAEGSIYLMFCGDPTDNGQAETTSNTDKIAEKHQKKEGLKVNTAGVPGAESELLRSPQPQHKLSISKIQKISGVHAPTYRETTPTGHDSAKKIQRVTGIGVLSETIQQQKRIREEHKIQLHGEEVSPLSNNGSDYGSEEPKTAVSELDGDAEGHGKGYFSGSSWGYFGSGHPYRRSTGSTGLPSPLRLIRPSRPSRSPEKELPEPARYGGYLPRPALSPWLESERMSPGWNTPSGKFSPDLYHETIKEVAEAGTNSPEGENRSRRAELAAQRFLQADGTGSAGNHGSPNPKPLPPLPHQRRHPHQLGHFPDARPTGSSERIQPVWRPYNTQQELPRALPSKFDFDSDSDSDSKPNTIGTSDTGGSIPASITSDISDGNRHRRPRHHHHHRSSGIMAKVFHRTSATSMTTAPGSPPPVPTNTPQQPTFPQDTHPHHHTTTQDGIHHSNNSRPNPNPNPTPQPLPTSTSQPQPVSTSTSSNTNTRALKPKSSLTSLAARTNNLVGAAADFILAKTAEERRRQRLKNYISVFGVWGDRFCVVGDGDSENSFLRVAVCGGGGGGGGLGNGSGEGGGGFRSRLASAPAVPSASSMPSAAVLGVGGRGRADRASEKSKVLSYHPQPLTYTYHTVLYPKRRILPALVLPDTACTLLHGFGLLPPQRTPQPGRGSGECPASCTPTTPCSPVTSFHNRPLLGFRTGNCTKPPTRDPNHSSACAQDDEHTSPHRGATASASASRFARTPRRSSDDHPECPRRSGLRHRSSAASRIRRRSRRTKLPAAKPGKEIGLPLDDNKLPAPFRIEHLCYLPMNLARTELSRDPSSRASTPKEVAAVFSAPFHNFLRETDEEPRQETTSTRNTARRPPAAACHRGNWLRGQLTPWHDSQWRIHFFYVPSPTRRGSSRACARAGWRRCRRVRGMGRVMSSMVPGGGDGGGAGGGVGGGDGKKKKKGGELERYKVWGMTARMLVDAATVAYDEKPEFEHNRHFGDEGIIETLARMGRMGEKKRAGSVVSAEDWKRAREAEKEAKRREEEEKEKGEPSKM